MSVRADNIKFMFQIIVTNEFSLTHTKKQTVRLSVKALNATQIKHICQCVNTTHPACTCLSSTSCFKLPVATYGGSEFDVIIFRILYLCQTII